MPVINMIPAKKPPFFDSNKFLDFSDIRMAVDH